MRGQLCEEAERMANCLVCTINIQQGKFDMRNHWQQKIQKCIRPVRLAISVELGQMRSFQARGQDTSPTTASAMRSVHPSGARADSDRTHDPRLLR